MPLKNLQLLVWLTQLGLSVAVPLAGCVWLSTWLRDTFSLGDWVLWVGVVFGAVCALEGFLSSLRVLNRISKEKKDDPPDVFFNDHA